KISRKVTISGFVKDQATGEDLVGAHIINQSTRQGIIANTYGFFSLEFDNYPQRITVTYVGYEPIELELQTQQDTLVNVYLSANSSELQEVIVSGEISTYEKVQMGAITLQRKEIKSLPAFFGEVDLLKTIQLLPGVQSGTDGSAGVYVRGGGPDQNLILLDGVPVYNANHLFGFFSVFNADAIQSVELIKGGFPARYGGRLSSVIDIKMKEGNSQEFQAEGAVGNIAAKLTLEGPLGKNKRTSYMLSGRRTYLDAFVVPIARLANSKRIASYHFWDVNAKINHRFSDKNRAFLSVYAGRDKFREEYTNTIKIPNFREESNELSGLNWGNVTAAARWNHIYSPKLFGNVTATFSRYQFNLFTENDFIFNISGEVDSVFQKNNYESSVQDWAIKLDYDYAPSNSHRVRFGASAIRHFFRPGASRFQSQLATDTTFGSTEIVTSEYYAYLEDAWQATQRLQFNLGLHLSGSHTENTFYTSVQPRFLLNYLVGSRSSFRLSYAKMAQYIHLLVNSGIGLPTDLWLPVTDEVEPQLSDQIAIGYARELRRDFELSIESYYKWMNNLIEYKDGAGFLDIDDSWDNKIEVGKGYSYGIEVLLQRKRGRTTGWLGYTWSRSFRDFDNLNFGRRFPYRYDRPHDVSLTLNHQIKSNISASAIWVFGTGPAITLPTSTFLVSHGHITGNQTTELATNYPSRNAARMRDYHRLDLSITFTKEKRWGERKWVFGLFNAYSRLNPVFADLRNEPGSDKKFVQLSLFPIIPSVSFQFKF
ncbi:MAG: TonB-dependent receptor, partial [Bacteroidota bacterium]